MPNRFDQKKEVIKTNSVHFFSYLPVISFTYHTEITLEKKIYAYNYFLQMILYSAELNANRAFILSQLKHPNKYYYASASHSM